MGRIGKRVLSWTLCMMMAVGMLPGMTRKAKATAPDIGISWKEDLQRYEISSYNGLLTFAKIVNGELGDGALYVPDNPAGACAIIILPDGVEAIDASASAIADSSWTPIGTENNRYTGTFDGNNKKINGLTIDSASDYVGLFGYVGAGGTVLNVILENGEIKGNDFVGGVVGRVLGGTITNSYNTSAVKGGEDVGGVVGRCSEGGAVTNCYNTGTVTGNDYSVGGVVGETFGTITNCYNIGAVIGSGSNVGGVAGYNGNNRKVTNCYNTGKVTGSGNDVGGVVGNNFGVVTNTYNIGDVRGGSSGVGGVVGGNSGRVANCYNTGSVRTGGSEVGGVVGFSTGIITNCYNTGGVDGYSEVGGVVGKGFADSTVTNCYYDIVLFTTAKAIGNSDDTENVKGLTTAEMTGKDAIGVNTMNFTYGEEESSPWLTKANGFSENGKYNFYYPHLKGFDWGDDKYWTAKSELSIQFEEPESYEYDGTSKYPTVSKVVSDEKELSAETDYEVILSDTECINAGEYSLTIRFKDTGCMKGYPSVEKKFTITKKEITITAQSKDFTYNGEPQSWDGYDVEGLFGDDKITAVVTGIITYPNESPVANKLESYEFTKGNAGNYSVTTKDGKLTMTTAMIPITITADSQEWVYDGQAHENTEVTITSGSLLTGDKLVAVASGSITTVSDSKEDNNPVADGYKIMHDTQDVTGNYVITAVAGTLEITKKPLTITADSASKEYDKTALTKDSYTSTGLADGDTIKSVTITGSQTTTGKSENVPSKAVIVNAKGEDVTDCYEIAYKNGTLTVTAPQEPALTDDQKPAPKKDLKEDGKEQILVLDPANLPDGYTIEYSTDGGKTWTPVPTGSQSGEYTIEVFYKADENHTDFFGDTLNVIIQGVYNQTDSDGDWTKGSGKTYTFRIKKAFNDEVTYDNLTGVFVDGKPVEAGKDYTAAKGSAIITFAADYLETLSVDEHKIRVTFKDGEVTVPLKVLAAIATPAPAVDATPTTGDTSMPILWAMLILLSMAGVAVVVEKKRRRA